MKDLELDYLFSAAHVLDLMRQCGRKPQVTEKILAASFELLEPGLDRGRLLQETTTFFRRRAAMVPQGLEGLPSLWLRTIPDALLLTCESHWNWIPYMVAELRHESGVLRVRFAQEEPQDSDKVTSWDEVRIVLNVCPRPNLWFPLDGEMERRIWATHPELRTELFHVPPFGNSHGT